MCSSRPVAARRNLVPYILGGPLRPPRGPPRAANPPSTPHMRAWLLPSSRAVPSLPGGVLAHDDPRSPRCGAGVATDANGRAATMAVDRNPRKVRANAHDKEKDHEGFRECGENGPVDTSVTSGVASEPGGHGKHRWKWCSACHSRAGAERYGCWKTDKVRESRPNCFLELAARRVVLAVSLTAAGP